MSHSALENIIREIIALDGPLSIADYMVLCLTHPDHGYYTSGAPIGGRGSASRQGGDFITAPEISQLFGEMIGVWCMEMWQALGSPKKLNLVELGPGRGTLMKDLLRVSNALPGFFDALNLHLVEVSPVLAEQQSLTLAPFGKQIKWHRDMRDLPTGETIILGNEFLDAIPFRQWVKVEGKWLERAVGLVDDELAYVTRPGTLNSNDLPTGHEEATDGAAFESAPAREALISDIALHLKANNGAALFIDYGHLESGFGDTFQAVQNHAHCSPLDDPGRADLTNHVDFQPLVACAVHNGCVAPHPMSQGNFLLELGLLERAGQLGSSQSTNIQEQLQTAVERLAGPNQMGNLFKVFAFGAPAHLTNRFTGFPI